MHIHLLLQILFFFFFNDTATTEIYTLSLHDALPILQSGSAFALCILGLSWAFRDQKRRCPVCLRRSEEHTSELQSRLHLVCRLLLEKKKTSTIYLEFSHEHRPQDASMSLNTDAFAHH